MAEQKKPDDKQKPTELADDQLAKVSGGHKKDEGSSKKDATP